MASDEISSAADRDLLGIGHYTAKRWGESQAVKYADALREHFSSIGQGTARTRVLLSEGSGLRISHHLHHFDAYVQVPLF